MKLVLKEYAPKWMFKLGKTISIILEMVGIFFHETKQLICVASNNTYDNLKYNFLLNTHILEKGLGHIDFRERFGDSVLKELSLNIKEWNKYNYDKTDFPYQNAISALNAYYNKHKTAGTDIKFMYSYFSEKIMEEIVSNHSDFGGTKYIKKEEVLSYNSFQELSEKRFSFRNFSNKELSLDKIKLAVAIAKKSPSSCNRQSIRARVLKDKDLIQRVLELHRGLKECPPVLIMLTYDEECYPNGKTRNLGFVDGGLFMMSLCYALHELGLSQTIINGTQGFKTAREIKNIYQAKKLEKIVGFIAVGNMEEEMLIGKSSRTELDDTLYIVEEELHG